MSPLMERDFFGDLPSEITTNILSRLSIRSLAISKSVCKLWLNLINSDDFHKSEIKTPPALALLTKKTMGSTCCTIFEIEDRDEFDTEKSHDLHYIPLMDLEIPHGNGEFMEGITASGLLLLYSQSMEGNPLYLCNLITRESDYGHRVYTLGTGTWRRVEAGAASGFKFFGQNIVCNGNLHWIVFDLSHNIWICGFDVETECFRIFSVPPGGDRGGDLSVLKDCLCYSYAHDNEVVIWMMKEYQVEDSWTIEYKLRTISFGFDFDLDYICVHPTKHFKDGDILMLLDETDLVYYSNKIRTFQRVGIFKDAAAGYLTALIFTPSLFSLKNFGFENVISF
ncbi:F-box protein CPR1-like [Salvia splendens]|uniref:F-box protein CPR1-like n=1 Tax=Salvia splendens TaxID=180675 RepID=UPI001C252DEE|nr:F-box protein CPR1-like [Salvia splendens]